MIFTIEPMINAGKAAISELPDGWTIVTKDRSLSAQWEHTVLVTETGVEVLTLSAGCPRPKLVAARFAGAEACRRSARNDAPPTNCQTRRHGSQERLGRGHRPQLKRPMKRGRRPSPAAGRCQLVDQVLVRLWQEACAMPLGLSLVAVGGYGRASSSPLGRRPPVAAASITSPAKRERSSRTLIGLLWDIGLDIGHSVRTVWQCMTKPPRHHGADQPARSPTRLRQPQPVRRIRQARCAQLDPGAFYKAKRLEQDERHARFTTRPTRWNPTARRAPAGCATCRSWAGSAAPPGLGDSWRDLARRGLITRGEGPPAARARTFLQHSASACITAHRARARIACSSTTRRSSPASSA
jgi:hypothetical protein